VKRKNSLAPRYISTVDSGNFAVCLETLSNSIREVQDNLVLNQKEALHDKTILMERALNKDSVSSQTKNNVLKIIFKIRYNNSGFTYENPYTSTKNNAILLKLINEAKIRYRKESQEKSVATGLMYWLSRSEKLLLASNNDIERLYPWVNDKNQNILDYFINFCRDFKLHKLAQKIDQEIKSELKNNLSLTEKSKIKNYLKEMKESLENHLKTTNDLIDKIEKIVKEFDFSLLFDSERKLFRIGYNLDKKRFDKNYYDLYASEARLSSYFAISHNQVPASHWSRLGRPMANYKGRLALLSWGGSIFEYFFPQLFLPRKNGTLLDITLKNAFWGHLSYAKENSIPWGISESSYGQKGKNKDYLYKIHGIPELGLRRVTKKDLVVAPYATFLALEERPKLAMQNIEWLQDSGCEGKYGFYESVDFGGKKEGEIAKTYMSHHQGAIIISIVNCLENRAFENRFMKNPKAKSISYILEEKINKNSKLREVYSIEKEQSPKILAKIKIKPEAPYLDAPLINILSNGRLKSYTSSRGSGFLEYGNISLTPFNRDPVLDESGLFIYIKDHRSDKIWSSTYQPTLAEPESYQYRFSKNYIRFERVDSKIQTTTEISIHPDLNAEIRALTLQNKSEKRKTLTFSSYGDVALSSHDEYWSHPSFQKLKIRKEKRSSEVLVFKRMVPRGTHSPVFAHLAFAPSEISKTFEPFTEKSNVFGAGNISEPEFMKKLTLKDEKRGFEACFAIRGNVSLLPLEKKTIYFVNLYAGREDRYKKSIDLLGDYNSISEAIIQAKKAEDRQESESNRIQKITSLIFYHRPQIKTNSQIIKITKEAISINWQIPTVLIEVGQNFTKNFVFEAIKSLSSVLNLGLRFNIIILNHERDEYSKTIGNYVDQVIDQLDGSPENKVLFRKYTTILSSAGLSSEILSGLPSICNLHWDASKKSLINLINKDFRNI